MNDYYGGHPPTEQKKKKTKRRNYIEIEWMLTVATITEKKMISFHKQNQNSMWSARVSSSIQKNDQSVNFNVCMHFIVPNNKTSFFLFNRKSENGAKKKPSTISHLRHLKCHLISFSNTHHHTYKRKEWESVWKKNVISLLFKFQFKIGRKKNSSSTGMLLWCYAGSLLKIQHVNTEPHRIWRRDQKYGERKNEINFHWI